MTTRIRVVIVDDHPMFREGVAATLRADTRTQVVAQGATAEEAVRLCQDHHPDVALLDIGMPGNGLNAIREIARVCPYVKTVILTASEAEDHVASALEFGARGYVLKGVSASELLSTIVAVRAGETYVMPCLAGRILTRLRQTTNACAERARTPLTPREEEILERVAEGSTNKEIARDIGITEKTVKHYMTNIMEKLQVRNRVEAALAVHDRKSKQQKPPFASEAAASGASGNRNEL